MITYLLDTDHFTLLTWGDANVSRNVAANRNKGIGVSIVTVHEQLVGWLTALNKARDNAKKAAIFQRMADVIPELAQFAIVSFELSAMDRFDALLFQRLNVASNDLKIGAIALDRGAVVVTRNSQDFRRIPGLAIEDWSV